MTTITFSDQSQMQLQESFQEIIQNFKDENLLVRPSVFYRSVDMDVVETPDNYIATVHNPEIEIIAKGETVEAEEVETVEEQENKTFDLSNIVKPEEETKITLQFLESEEIHKMKVSKCHKITFDELGQVRRLHIFPRKSPKKKNPSMIDIHKDIVSKDYLREAMTGIYQDAENGCLVSTDAHKLLCIYQDGIKESKIINIKTGQEIDARYPDYKMVIPEEIETKHLFNIDELINQVNGIVSVNRFIVDKTIYVKFNGSLLHPQFVLQCLKSLRMAGAENVTLEQKEPNKKLIIRDTESKNFALVMPVLSDVESLYHTILETVLPDPSGPDETTEAEAETTEAEAETQEAEAEAEAEPETQEAEAEAEAEPEPTAESEPAETKNYITSDDLEESEYFQPTEDKKYYVADYPFGWSKRGQMFYWIEQNKNGARLVRQGRSNGILHEPKKSTYKKDIVCYLNEDGHLKYNCIYASDLNRKEIIDNHISKLESIKELSQYSADLIAKIKGNFKHEIKMKFSSKIDKSFTRPAIKVTFKGEKVTKEDCYKAVNDYLNTDSPGKNIFSLDGGFRIFRDSNEIGFLDSEVFENYKANYEDEIDPFAEQTEEKPKLMALKSKIKKIEKPLFTGDATKEEITKDWTYQKKIRNEIYKCRLTSIVTKKVTRYEPGKGTILSERKIYNFVYLEDRFYSNKFFAYDPKVVDGILDTNR